MSFFSGNRRQVEDDEFDEPSQPQTARKPVGFETVLGANSELTGSLSSKANVRIDGSFEGALEIDGNILIGETGKIIADVNARNIVIAGSVRGNVNGNKVQLLRTSRVWGDINATAITTEEGAFIDGKITMVKHEAASQTFEISPGTSVDDEDEHIEVVEGEPVIEDEDDN